MVGRPLSVFLGVLVLCTATTAATCPFDGGFAARLNASSCPPTAPVSCGNGLQPRCCPTGTICAGDGDYSNNYCCDSSDSSTEALSACTADILASPRCPAAGWSLFNINGSFDDGGFCCLAGNNGTYGYLAGGGTGVECVDAPTSADDDPGSGLYWADVVAQATCTTATTSTSSTTAATATTATTATSSTSSTASTASTSSTTSATASSTNTSAAGGGGSKVSGGAIGGIVVGCFAGVALAAAGALFLWRRRRALSTLPLLDGSRSPPQQPPQQQQYWPSPDQQQTYPTMTAYMPVQQNSAEPATLPVEMEFHSYSVPVELYAGK